MAGSGEAKANTIRITGFGVTFFKVGVTFLFFFFGSAKVSVSVVNAESASVENMADVTTESIASCDDLLSSVLKSSAFVK
jgi:hypothetical protein